MKVLNNDMHIFFSGIGGIGMSGIAEILLKSGYKVSGSDRELSNITQNLSSKGAKIYQGHNPDNLKKVDILVYSSAISDDNPERQTARLLGITEIRRAEMLAQIMHGKHGIAIAGTHGKTTTTSIFSEVAIQGGLDPTIVAGGRIKSLKSNARLGYGEFFITEADEYDRSFLALSPTLAVITNIEPDHLDCYKNFNDIKKTFLQFAHKVPFFGKVICNIDDPAVKALLPQISRPVATYGSSEQADYRVINLRFDHSRNSFNVVKHGNIIGEINLRIPGEHNVKNALASIALGDILEIPFHKIKTAIDSFNGVERRFEIKGEINNILVVDDYAHHPTEIDVTLKSAKKGWGKRVVAVFQPHLYSRTRDFYKEFAASLMLADMLVITDIYPAREEPIEGVTGELIVKELQNKGYKKVHYVPDKTCISDYILTIVKPDDLVIMMGAGDIGKSAHELINKLEMNNKKVSKHK